MHSRFLNTLDLETCKIHPSQCTENHTQSLILYQRQMLSKIPDEIIWIIPVDLLLPCVQTSSFLSVTQLYLTPHYPLSAIRLHAMEAYYIAHASGTLSLTIENIIRRAVLWYNIINDTHAERPHMPLSNFVGNGCPPSDQLPAFFL